MADEPQIAAGLHVDWPSRGAFALACVALLLVTAIAYSPVLRAGLLGWDDYGTIAKNPWLNPPSLDGVSWYWRHSNMHLYVPITYTVWSLLAAIAHAIRPGAEMWPVPFHVANLVFHLTTITLVIAILRRLGLTRASALLGAAVFALHPLNVEAVAWASGLKDVLSTTLMFAAALAWIGPRDARSPWRWAVIATAFYVLALLAKPTAIVTPILAWLLGLAAGRPARASAARLVPWVILALPIALIGRAVQPPSSGEVVALALRPLVAIDAIGFDLAKLAWPVSLAVDHGRTPTRLLANELSQRHLFVTLAACIAFATAFILAGTRSRRLALIGLAIALVSLSPVLGIVPFDFQAISSVADHYCYPAMIGTALLVAALASTLDRRMIAGLIIALSFPLAAASYRQAQTWRDDTTLFRQVLAVNPKSWTAASAFSFIALQENRPEDAGHWAQQALEQNPRFPTAWVDLASAQSRLGYDWLAIGSLGHAYEIEPDNAIVNLNLGGLLAAQGDLTHALPLLQRAVDLEPTNPAALGNLGAAFLQTGRAREGLQHLNLAAKFAPDDLSIRTRHAIALAANGQADAARRELTAVLKTDAKNMSARDALDRLNAAATRPAG